VTSNLRLKLTGADEQKLAKKYTQNTEAYQLYLKGNYEWNKGTQEDIQKAIQYYEQALEKDPNFALAYAGLSASYGALGNGYLPPNENFPRAKAYSAKALALDDTLAQAHGSMGAVRLFYDWDWAELEKEFRRAQELEPNYPDAHQLYAAYLETAGRFDEALAEAKLAQDMDPLSPMFGAEVGFTYYFAGQYDEAIAQLQKTLNLEPHWADAYQYLGQSYEQKKMYAKAIETLQKGIAQTERQPGLISSLGHTYAVSGDRDKAVKAIKDLQTLSKKRYVSPYWTAVIYAGLGDRDQAFAWLEKALQDRAMLLIWLNVEPQFSLLRTDARFSQLTKQIGLNDLEPARPH
jgi:tetratricopeptide (TPR) repeat protein